MRDHRSKKRRNSPHRVNVLRSADDAVLGRLVNITVKGLMFLAEESQAAGTVLHMRLPLPTVTSGKAYIEVQGKVAWCKADQNPRFQRIGVEFEGMDAEEGYLIETVLQRLHLVG